MDNADTADAAGLLAVLVEAGMTPAQAIGSAGETCVGTAGIALRQVADDLQHGFPTLVALDRASRNHPPAARALCEILASGVESGARISERLREFSSDLRLLDATDASTSARAASVKVLLPLGFLILPAFVLTCMVPLFTQGLSGLGI